MKTYYRLSLLLPILVPMLVCLAHLSTWHNGMTIDEFLAQMDVLSWLFVLSLGVGGIPYLVLAAGLLWWMRGKSEIEMRAGLLLAPLLLGPVDWVCILFWRTAQFLMSHGSKNFDNSDTNIFLFAILGMIWGYGYIALAFSAAWIYRRITGANWH